MGQVTAGGTAQPYRPSNGTARPFSAGTLVAECAVSRGSASVAIAALIEHGTVRPAPEAGPKMFKVVDVNGGGE